MAVKYLKSSRTLLSASLMESRTGKPHIPHFTTMIQDMRVNEQESYQNEMSNNLKIRIHTLGCCRGTALHKTYRDYLTGIDHDEYLG